MTFNATLTIDTLPTAKTVTLNGNDEIIKFRDTQIGSKVSSLVITNLDASAELYIRFTTSADAASNHYTLLAGQSVNLDFRKEGTTNPVISGTSGKKFSFLAI